MTAYLGRSFSVACSSGTVSSDELARRWEETFGKRKAPPPCNHPTLGERGSGYCPDCDSHVERLRATLGVTPDGETHITSLVPADMNGEFISAFLSAPAGIDVPRPGWAKIAHCTSPAPAVYAQEAMPDSPAVPDACEAPGGAQELSPRDDAEPGEGRSS